MRTNASFVQRLAMLGLFFGLAGGAQAATISIAPYNSTAEGLELSVDVTVDSGQAFFSFSNDSTGDAADSVIARIYFEIGLGDLGLSSGSVVGGNGTSFSTSFGGPAAPPGANNVNWQGELTAFGADAPGPQNGVNVGDELIIAFAYDGTLQTLLDGLTDANGNARIGAHVLDCQNGNSCAGTTVVPIPAALPLFFGALVSMFAVRRRAS